MKNHFGHFNASEETLAREMWEFRTCQRADGSYYGTGGQCRKGTETDKPEKEEKKGKKSGGGGDSISGLKKEHAKVKKALYAGEEPWDREDAMHAKVAKIDRKTANLLKKATAIQSKLDSISDKGSDEFRKEAKKFDKVHDQLRDRVDQFLGEN